MKETKRNYRNYLPFVAFIILLFVSIMIIMIMIALALHRMINSENTIPVAIVAALAVIYLSTVGIFLVVGGILYLIARLEDYPGEKRAKNVKRK